MVCTIAHNQRAFVCTAMPTRSSALASCCTLSVRGTCSMCIQMHVNFHRHAHMSSIQARMTSGASDLAAPAQVAIACVAAWIASLPCFMAASWSGFSAIIYVVCGHAQLSCAHMCVCVPRRMHEALLAELLAAAGLGQASQSHLASRARACHAASLLASICRTAWLPPC